MRRRTKGQPRGLLIVGLCSDDLEAEVLARVAEPSDGAGRRRLEHVFHRTIWIS